MQALLRPRSHLPGLHLRFTNLQNLRHCTTTTASTASYITQQKPAYTLPFYGATDSELSSLPDTTIRKALKAYGALIRPRDTSSDLRHRLRNLTNAEYRPSLLTISGVVVSNKMNKSVVVAARRRAYSNKLRMPYMRTRRFMAHDEFDLCREGDRVVIRACRHMSRRKSHVVVQNFGDQTRAAPDERRIVVEDIQVASE